MCLKKDPNQAALVSTLSDEMENHLSAGNAWKVNGTGVNILAFNLIIIREKFSQK